jgi:hypothetical protein
VGLFYCEYSKGERIKFCFKLQMLETHGDAFAAVLLVIFRSGDSCSQNSCIPFRLIKTPYKKTFTSFVRTVATKIRLNIV